MLLNQLKELNNNIKETEKQIVDVLGQQIYFNHDDREYADRELILSELFEELEVLKNKKEEIRNLLEDEL